MQMIGVQMSLYDHDGDYSGTTPFLPKKGTLRNEMECNCRVVASRSK